jgi:hypothetical protein
MHEHHRCTNCGAQLTPQADGRTLACTFCGAKLQTAIEVDQLAAGLRLDMQNVEGFLYRLSHELHLTFSHCSKLEREGERLHHFELHLDPDLFVAKREPHGLVAMHRKMVRGIALKTNTLPIDRWVHALTEALARHANENARVAQVLAQLRVE